MICFPRHGYETDFTALMYIIYGSIRREDIFHLSGWGHRFFGWSFGAVYRRFNWCLFSIFIVFLIYKSFIICLCMCIREMPIIHLFEWLDFCWAYPRGIILTHCFIVPQLSWPSSWLFDSILRPFLFLPLEDSCPAFFRSSVNRTFP